MTYEGNNSNILIALSLIIILCIVGIVGFYLYDKKEPVQQEKIIEYNNLTFTIETEGVNKVSYEVIDVSGTVVQEGMASYGVLEQYKKASNMSNYTIEVRNPDYYISNILCDYSRICGVSIDRISDVEGNFFMFESNGELVYSFKNGVVKDALLCVGWDSGIYQVDLFNLTYFEVPGRLIEECDMCYYLGNLSNDYNFYNFNWSFSTDLACRADNGCYIDFFLIDMNGVSCDFCLEDFKKTTYIKR